MLCLQTVALHVSCPSVLSWMSPGVPGTEFPNDTGHDNRRRAALGLRNWYHKAMKKAKQNGWHGVEHSSFYDLQDDATVCERVKTVCSGDL